MMTPEEYDDKALRVGRKVPPAMQALVDLYVEAVPASEKGKPITDVRAAFLHGGITALALVSVEGDQKLALRLAELLVDQARAR
jgi:hypothetical protein